TLYVQNLLGYSPFQGGLRILPATVLIFLVPIVARRFGKGIRSGLMLGAGMTLIAAGLLLMSRLSNDSRWTVLLPGLLLAGVGIAAARRRQGIRPRRPARRRLDAGAAPARRPRRARLRAALLPGADGARGRRLRVRRDDPSRGGCGSRTRRHAARLGRRSSARFAPLRDVLGG